MRVLREVHEVQGSYSGHRGDEKDQSGEKGTSLRELMVRCK